MRNQIVRGEKKTISKEKALLIIIVATLIAQPITYASYIIYSNIMAPAQAGGYALALNESTYNGTAFTITGSLKNNGVGVEGVAVAIYTNNSATDANDGHLSMLLGSTTTTTNGAFTYFYAVADGKWYCFQAQRQVP